MEQDEIDLEDGEISNDSDSYTPLERPSDYSKTQPLPRLPPHLGVESESEEEIIISNDSDSDSDPNMKTKKKPKVSLRPIQQLRTRKPKKYDIWSSRLQEETLAATLVNCDVDKRDRSRDVESYDYTIAQRYYDDEEDVNRFSQIKERTNNKRTRSDRDNINLRHIQRSPSDDTSRGEARIIPDLTVTLNNAAEEIASEIASKLNEEKQELILSVINVMGKQKAIEFYEETQKVEEEGGMLIMNKTRRRTPGGVFLFLVRHDYHITLDQKNRIFGEERQRFKQYTKKKQKQKNLDRKKAIQAQNPRILPELLTRAEAFSTANSTKKNKESCDQDFVNPPPTPETDHCDNSRDGMEGSTSPVINSNDALDTERGGLNSYDDDFLDLGCAADMELF
ncbi:phosphorylated adapter RNA export protein [Diabrotica virgifera virgifera]|uniref:Phosphorylated adapter RNA export protein n=1 Tax=Diabrotica virgifera virgifera TaxID=50390 RepID=A0A6P7FEU1_DIAVI|nr:phosphorylated adapter RNA export protein [Diabrotica virgifera virgifera]XP_050499295.1 phosphorylated adapter RNA export protein [Diabrotica virgifera virgifera]XP_050499296.1 phosphorylated adapter RNA export protein [Diabrotica virgifera virgifera]